MILPPGTSLPPPSACIASDACWIARKQLSRGGVAPSALRRILSAADQEHSPPERVDPHRLHKVVGIQVLQRPMRRDAGLCIAMRPQSAPWARPRRRRGRRRTLAKKKSSRPSSSTARLHSSRMSLGSAASPWRSVAWRRNRGDGTAVNQRGPLSSAREPDPPWPPAG